MPRGFRDYYIEFTSITRHTLQVSATSPKKCLEAAEQAARGEWIDGLQVHEAEKPVLIHSPYGSLDFGINEDGPFMSGPAPGERPEDPDPKAWLRELGYRLIADADAARLPDPSQKIMCPSRTFQVREGTDGKWLYKCDDCGRVSRTGRLHPKPWRNTASHDKTMASAWDMGGAILGGVTRTR